MTTTSARQAGVRWTSAAQVLDQVRRRPGITRTEVAHRLALTSSSATQICARLRDLDLLVEQPAPPVGRGRPTTTLNPHPAGPLTAVVDVQHEVVTAAVADASGHLHERTSHRPAQRSPHEVLAVVREMLGAIEGRHGQRVRAVSLSVAATIDRARVLQAATLGWEGVDLTAAVPRALADRPLVVTNDATAAALAEARTPVTAGARAVLYLTITVGIGGALVSEGRALGGAHGAGGELGHLPFGSPDQPCPCGANGCWDVEVDGRAMARHRDHPSPADPYTYAQKTLAEAANAGDPGAQQAAQRCARALGTGIAGLVNALDADHVVLGGLAPDLRRTAPRPFADAFTAGLMRWRRAQAPPITDTVHGADVSLLGAAEIGLDHALSDTGLSSWAALHNGAPR